MTMNRLHRLRLALWTNTERSWFFSATAGALFAAAVIYGHIHHEMWKDELHCWAVGRNASGLYDLLTGERRYDGHPFLWYYLLHLVTLVTRSYLALHVVGVVLIVAAAVLWLRYAPLPRLLRLLLLGSYYLLYEYGVVTRSYSLGILLTFAFCALYHPLRIRFVPLATLLGLLAATSMYGFLMAGALALFLFTRTLRLAAPSQEQDRLHLTVSADWLAGLLIFGAFVVLTVVTTIPPSDAHYTPPLSFDLTTDVFAKDFSNFWAVLFPFNAWDAWDWTRYDYLGASFSEHARVALGLAWFVLWVAALARAPSLAIGFASAILLMMVAQHGIYLAAPRHLGHYLILLLACIWLYHAELRGRRFPGVLYVALVGNLAVQAATGVAALRSEARTLFSGAEAAASFIREQHIEDLPMVGHSDHAAATVATALDRPMWLLSTGETSDVVVEHNRLGTADTSQVLRVAESLARAAHGSSLLVLNHLLVVEPLPTLEIRLLYQPSPALVADETFFLYRVDLREPQALNAQTLNSTF